MLQHNFTTNLISTQYSIYLLSDHWKNFRQKYLLKKKRKNKLYCSICKSITNLNIHHLNYKHLGKEKSLDVTLLCEVCHHKVHELARKILKEHKGRNLLSITNRCISTTLKNRNSKYNFRRYQTGKFSQRGNGKPINRVGKQELITQSRVMRVGLG